MSYVFIFKKKEKPQVKPQNGIRPVLLSLRETIYIQASLDPFLGRLQADEGECHVMFC
jgi:hypothetical protein